MLQTLFHIPTEIAGIPLFGFGLLLFLWIAFSIGLLGWSVWKKGFTREVIDYLPFLVLIAVMLVWILPGIAGDEGIPIRAWGTMLLVGVLASTGLLIYRGRRYGLDSDMTMSLVFWMVIPGLIGARVFYVIEYWETFQRLTVVETFLAAINMTEGGMVVYGSLIGALSGLLIFVKKRGLRLLVLGDLLAPCLVLGLALGRIGCLLNGCCYGGACDHAWAVTFPPGSPPYASQVMRGEMSGFRYGPDEAGQPTILRVEPNSPAARAGLEVGQVIERVNGQPVQEIEPIELIELIERTLYNAYGNRQPVQFEMTDGTKQTLGPLEIARRSRPIHPTQLYSSANALIICLILLAYSPFRRRDGELFALLLTLYPITRFILEIIRTDELSVFGTGLSISQNVSILILVGIVALWIFLLRRPVGVSTSIFVEGKKTE